MHMKSTIPCGILCFLLMTMCSCKGQSDGDQGSAVSRTSHGKIVGGGCDGCELMYVDMPQNISSVDTSTAWQSEGQRILISGKVLKMDGKTPVSDVIVYYWHTDTDGYYSGGSGKAASHGRIRGWVQSDEQGNYAIYTVRPAGYPNTDMPAHIHLSIKEPNIPDEYYTDELVFDDDRLLTGAKRKRLSNRGGSGVLRPLLGEGMQVAEHNIILGLNIPNYPVVKDRKVESGRQVGEDNPSFTPFHAWGPDRGSKTCPVCKYGRYHGIVFFVGNNPDWEQVKQWLVFLESESVKREKYLKAYFVYGNEKDYNKAHRDTELAQLGMELGISNLALTFVPSFTDTVSEVHLNRINPNVENTFIIYRNRNIIGKFINLKPSAENLNSISHMLDKTKNEYFDLPEPPHD